MLCRTIVFLILATTSVFAQAPAKEPPRKPETFDVGGRKAFLFAAPSPAAGKPWVWYAPTFQNGLATSGDKWFYFGRWTAKGIAVAGYDLGEVRGSPGSTEKFAAFHAEMVKRGYSPKPVLLGQSRGGMMMLAFAMRHPDKAGAFAGIYPVCNLASWPMKNSKAATLADYGLTEEQITADLARLNPIENLKGLAERGVPMFSVHGDSDVVVPLELDSGLLKQRYEALGGKCAVKVIPGLGHKVDPAFFQCEELAAFVLEAALQKR